MNYLLSRVLEFFPDRLNSAKWQTRFQTHGLDRIQEARKRKRPVLLVCFHFGTFKLIPFWLRARGVPVIALLRGNSEVRSRVKRLKDTLSPFPDLPTVLYNQDQLRRALDFLKAGRVLLLAADRETGRQVSVPIDRHWSFQMATGAIRLAARFHAELIPCCMRDNGRWHFQLDLLRPVPAEFLDSEADIPRAGEHVLRELLPFVDDHPEQCAHYLLDCFRPNESVAAAAPCSA